jgi:hypothetical protein
MNKPTVGQINDIYKYINKSYKDWNELNAGMGADWHYWLSGQIANYINLEQDELIKVLERIAKTDCKDSTCLKVSLARYVLNIKND